MRADYEEIYSFRRAGWKYNYIKTVDRLPIYIKTYGMYLRSRKNLKYKFPRWQYTHLFSRQKDVP